MKLIFTPEAGQDIEEAYFWYESNRCGLGDIFLNTLADTLKKIENTPLLYRVIVDDLRVARMRQFPYSIYYRCRSDQLVVIACFHQRRNPEEWTRRLS